MILQNCFQPAIIEYILHAKEGIPSYEKFMILPDLLNARLAKNIIFIRMTCSLHFGMKREIQ